MTRLRSHRSFCALLTWVTIAVLHTAPDVTAQTWAPTGLRFSALAATPSGFGLWRLDTSGGLHVSGDADPYDDDGSDPPPSGPPVPPSPSGLGRFVGLAPRVVGGEVTGLWMLTSRGEVVGRGMVPAVESAPADTIPSARYVDLAATPSGDGLWLLRTRGDVLSLGDAPSFERSGRLPRAVALAPTPSGGGLWVLDRRGDVVSFGNAASFDHDPIDINALLMEILRGQYREAVENLRHMLSNRRFVDLVPTPSGRGLWLLTEGGSIFGLGDAGLTEDLDGREPRRYVGLAASPAGDTLWLLTANGSIVTRRICGDCDTQP